MIKKFFENNISNSDGDRTLRIAGALYSGDTAIDAYPGTLAVQVSLLASKAFSGKKNGNAWKMKAAVQTDRRVYVFDPDAVHVVSDGTNHYNFGAETLGVKVPAGEMGAWQLLKDGDIMTWGDGNFAAQPSATEKYAVPGTGNSAGLWVPVDTAPTGGTFIEILEDVTITEGNIAGGSGYYCKVSVLAAASGTAPAAPVITNNTAEITASPVALAGTCVSGAEVKIYDNDEYIGDATVTLTDWAYSLAVTTGDHSVTAIAVVSGLVSPESAAYVFTATIA